MGAPRLGRPSSPRFGLLEVEASTDLDLALRENAVARLCVGAKKSGVIIAILELERGTRNRVHQGAHRSDVPVIEQVKCVTREHETDLLPDFETLCQSQVDIRSARHLERIGQKIWHAVGAAGS